MRLKNYEPNIKINAKKRKHGHKMGNIEEKKKEIKIKIKIKKL